MSTSGNLASSLAPSWKQEVNQRIAAHRKGKTGETGPQAVTGSHPILGDRASQAAARVAARFASAPSYSEMLANEARAAVMAAEAATRAAQKAQAAAQSILAGLEAASSAELIEDSPQAPSQSSFIPASVEQAERSGPARDDRAPARESSAPPKTTQPKAQAQTPETFTIRWEPDMPVRPSEASPIRTSQQPETFEATADEWRQPSAQAAEIAVVEPALPIYANLIQFPRELVAARKARPRLAEGPLAAGAQSSQLSIFEVDPDAISVQPDVEVPVQPVEAPAWNAPEWSGIKLDAQPEVEFVEEPASQPLLEQPLHPAPAGRRILAAVVDFTLVAGAFQFAAFMATRNLRSLPGLRVIEVGSAIALMVIGALYMMLFFTLAKATPGMRYARIGLCTFDAQIPTLAQRWARLVALLVSALPLGLGLMWAVFDENHLSWHDRLSRTYLRMS